MSLATGRRPVSTGALRVSRVLVACISLLSGLLLLLSLGVGWAHAATLDECVSVRVSNANAYWYVSSPVASPAPVSLQNAAVTVEDVVYAGEAVTPRVTVTLGEAALVEGEDYTVSCVGNDAVGSALAVVTGTGEYSATRGAAALGLAR